MRHTFCLSLGICLIALAGCGQGDDLIQEKFFEQQLDFAAGDRLEVKNVDGSIHVYGSTFPGVHLVARMRAYSVTRLAGIKVDIAQGGGVLSVHSIIPPAKQWGLGDRSGTIDYTLIVPQETKVIDLALVNGEISLEGLRGGKARADLVNGRIAARNCFADVDLHSSNGNIDFYYNWWENMACRLKGTIGNGGVGLLVPRGFSFQVHARTATGLIMGSLVSHKTGPTRKLDTTFGKEPVATVEMVSEHGNIRLNDFK